jgi:hypothetical protein
MGALAEQALLLGNWHLLGYAAIALAALAWRHWRAPALVGLSGAVGVGLAVLAVFATSSAGRATIGPAGVVGHAATAFAPLLALWVAQVAWTWVRDSLAVAAAAADVPDAAVEHADAPRTASSGAEPR